MGRILELLGIRPRRELVFVTRGKSSDTRNLEQIKADTTAKLRRCVRANSGVKG